MEETYCKLQEENDVTFEDVYNEYYSYVYSIENDDINREPHGQEYLKAAFGMIWERCV